MIEGLQEMLKRDFDITFKDVDLLDAAFTHASYVNETPERKKKLKYYERIEFLGDAVLELISSEFLFFEDEKMPEGQLTKARASMVCEPSLAFCAREIQLGDYLMLGKGEEVTGGRTRASVTSDALEALIGAIYLDGGFASAKEFILNFVLNDLEHKKLFYDSKTILQELVQANFSETISYHLIREEGPDHNKTFFVEVQIGNHVYGEGTGKTKKTAEADAAYNAIIKLHKKNIK